jgi:hypothetical protein
MRRIRAENKQSDGRNVVTITTTTTTVIATAAVINLARLRIGVEG